MENKEKENSNSIKIAPSEYKNYIDDIEKCIDNGHTYKETASIVDISIDYVRKIIQALNDPGSDIHNEERYNKIIKLHNEIVSFRQSENGKKNADNFRNKKTNIPITQYINPILTQEITIIDAANLSKTSILTVLLYLNRIQDEEIKKKLQPFLENYGITISYKKENSKSLSSYPFETKKGNSVNGFNISCFI